MLFVCNISGTRNDVHRSLQDGKTALMRASVMGNLECVKGLIENGAQVNVQDKVSAF